MTTPTSDQSQEQNDSLNKKFETVVRNTAIQMGCWTAEDDYLLINSTLHLCDLEQVHKKVKFSMPFSLENIQNRWQCLLYHVAISKMVVSKVQKLSMSQITNLHIPLNEDEEQLLMAIPSHTIPTILDNELDACLSRHSPKFWRNRTISELRNYWLQMREQGRLCDQQNAHNDQQKETSEEYGTSVKLSQLLAPFEFELLSRNKTEFVDKTEPPHALFYVNDRLCCMYSDQLNFGTSLPNQQFDICFDNTTTVHVQGMIMRKLGAHYIINNGNTPFRVNSTLLNPNEASPLGTRAVIHVLEHTMVFQAIVLPNSC